MACAKVKNALYSPEWTNRQYQVDYVESVVRLELQTTRVARGVDYVEPRKSVRA
jgi:hypothetical protein